MGELCGVDTKRCCCCFLDKPVLVLVFVSRMKDTQLGHSSVRTPLVHSIGQAVLAASGHEQLFMFRPRTRHKSAVNYKVDIINVVTCVDNRQTPTYPDWVSAVLYECKRRFAQCKAKPHSTTPSFARYNTKSLVFLCNV